jgi:hypothetical protein
MTPRLDSNRLGSPSAPNAAWISKAISGAGRGANPACVLSSRGTPASDRPAGVQLNPSPPGSFVNRYIRILRPPVSESLRNYVFLFCSRQDFVLLPSNPSAARDAGGSAAEEIHVEGKTSAANRDGRSRPTEPAARGRRRIPALFAWRSGAREEFELKDDREAVAAAGGAP